MKDFNRLPISRKREMILYQADYIGSIKYGFHNMYLYTYNPVFIIVSYVQDEDWVINILLAHEDRLHVYGPTLEELRQGL